MPTWAQLSGLLTDTQNKPVPFGNVILHRLPDSSYVSGQGTDEEGRFRIPAVSPGRYFLKCSSIGYTDYVLALELSDSLNLGAIVLENESSQLEEVVVSARRDLVQQTPFGKVVNVQNSLLTKGSNALQLLERLPGVMTDRQNGQFNLNGLSGVTVMINGRKVMMSQQEAMGLLENTLADNIEKVELITSPSACYDADGGAGIINIIMNEADSKKSRFGFTIMGGYGFGEKASLAMNYQKNWQKVSLTGSYGYARDVRRSGFEGFGTSQKPWILGGRGSAEFSTFGKETQNGHTLNLAAEYRPKNGFSLGTDWILSLAQNHNLSNNNVAWDTEAFGYLSLKGLSDGHSRRSNLIGSLYMNKNWGEGNTLGLDLSVLTYLNDSPTTIDSKYYDRNGEPAVSPSAIYTSGNRGQSLSNIRVGVAKMDYEKTFSKKLRGTFGVKASWSNNENDSSIKSLIDGVWQPDTRSQSLIFGKEKVLAAYSQFQFQLGPNIQLHGGLRYEYWRRDLNAEEQPFRITGFFPSFLVNKEWKESYRWQLGYTRRITRPLYTDLVSNLFYNDPTFVFSGNPKLKPAINNQIKVELNVPVLSTSLAFQHELHPILRHQITTNSEQNIGISSPQNLDYIKSLTLFLTVPLRLVNWWNLSVSSTTSLRKYQISYTPSVAAKAYVFQGISFSSNFKLPFAMELELSGWRNLPVYDGHNRANGFGIVNLGLAKKLKYNRGSFQLTLPDLFQSMKVHTHISGMTPIVFHINTVSDWRDESALYRIIKISYSRTLGGKIDSNKRGEIEEMKRVGR
ncbi:outer membrane beta-barrel protein [Salmonirosea aquatica]|uniref:outer membrane beta-barrel protein n=1 Tax=Salmonirosea aquatica TaxID=2654236 RepID=UPI003570F75D